MYYTKAKCCKSNKGDTMKKYLDILKKVALFKNIADNDLLSMLKCLNAKVEVYTKNQTIFSEGEPAKFVGIVLSGAVQIVKDDYYGNRSVVASVEPSQLFAEAFSCANVKALPVSVIATENSIVMLIDCKHIITTCSNSCVFHNTLINNLLDVVAHKNLVLNQKIEIMSKRTTREKLMSFLLAQAKKNGSNTFSIPYDRQTLADYLGVERSAMSAEISKLRKEGIIQSNKNNFTINEIEKL